MALSIPQLADKLRTEADAYKYLEDLRWNGQPVCPHCGSVGRHYFLTPKDGATRKTRTGSPSERRVWKCRACRKQFSVLTGTIFHGSKIAVRTWVFVVFEMASSKNGVAAKEIERKYGLTAKSAGFMMRRISEAMKREPMAGLLVMALVSRETGEIVTKVVPKVTGESLAADMRGEVAVERTVIHTDGAAHYPKMNLPLAGHQAVNHEAGEYVRGDVSTNQAESFFSQLKRSIDGTPSRQRSAP